MRTRKAQITEFHRALKLGDRAVSRRVGRALRDAAIVGAFEERYRALKILRSVEKRGGTIGQAMREMTAVSVLCALGYEGKAAAR